MQRQQRTAHSILIWVSVGLYDFHIIILNTIQFKKVWTYLEDYVKQRNIKFKLGDVQSCSVKTLSYQICDKYACGSKMKQDVTGGLVARKKDSNLIQSLGLTLNKSTTNNYMPASKLPFSPVCLAVVSNWLSFYTIHRSKAYPPFFYIGKKPCGIRWTAYRHTYKQSGIVILSSIKKPIYPSILCRNVEDLYIHTRSKQNTASAEWQPESADQKIFAVIRGWAWKLEQTIEMTQLVRSLEENGLALSFMS